MKTLLNVAVLFLAGAFGLALGWSILDLPVAAVNLPEQLTAQLDMSGVVHPVTAVLLNFRGYDTLLEIAVLLLALLGILALPRHVSDHQHRPFTANPVLQTLARVLVPLMLLVAGYILWAGAHRPGGAFQAGAVLAGAGVLSASGRPAASLGYAGSDIARRARGWLVGLYRGSGSAHGARHPIAISARLGRCADLNDRGKPDFIAWPYTGRALSHSGRFEGSGMNAALVYALTGTALFVLGVAGLILQPHLLRKILAFNIMGSGIFLVLVGLAQRAGTPDPVPQAMVLTGIVVAIAATALALALARQLLDMSGEMRLPEEKSGKDRLDV